MSDCLRGQWSSDIDSERKLESSASLSDFYFTNLLLTTKSKSRVYCCVVAFCEVALFLPASSVNVGFFDSLIMSIEGAQPGYTARLPASLFSVCTTNASGTMTFSVIMDQLWWNQINSSASTEKRYQCCQIPQKYVSAGTDSGLKQSYFSDCEARESLMIWAHVHLSNRLGTCCFSLLKGGSRDWTHMTQIQDNTFPPSCCLLHAVLTHDSLTPPNTHPAPAPSS